MDNKQLEQDLQALEDKKRQLQQQIEEVLRQKPKEKVLNAITKQRYFYLKEKSHVIFDRETGYLWPEKKLNIKLKVKRRNFENTNEVRQFVNELKALDYLSFKDWEIPSPNDFKVILKDENNYLPNFRYKDDTTHYIFRGGTLDQYRILNCDDKLEVFNDKNIRKKEAIRKEGGETTGISLEFALANVADSYSRGSDERIQNIQSDQLFLVNKRIAIDLPELDPNFDKFPAEEQQRIKDAREKQTMANCLQVFIQNQFIPVFDDHRIIPLYELLLNKLPKLNSELVTVDSNIKQLINIKNQQGELLSSTFNYRELLNFKQFDCQEIDNSLIRFTEATLEWCGLLEEKTAEYQLRQHKLITEGNAVTCNLAQKYKADSHLTHEENKLLETRQNFMFKRLNLNMNRPQANLASMKMQCHKLNNRLDEINDHENGLFELEQLAAQPRPSFDLVAENSATLLINVLKKMEFYEANRELVKALINQEHAWSKDYKTIKASAKDNLKKECEEDGIETNEWETWLQEWADKRRLIEQCLQPLIEKGLDSGGFKQQTPETTPVVLQLIEQLEQYKNKLDHFYLQDRKSIHQKFAFQTNGSVQEKFEAESELYKQTLIFQQDLHEIIFSLEKIEERLWLFQWSDVLVGMTIETILEFIRDKSLDNISKAVINDFSQLKLQNYATFINDAAASADLMNQWDKDYNSLMFKMRKELQNQVTEEKSYKINFERNRK